MKKSHPEMQIERILTVWCITVILWSFFRAYTNIPLLVSEFIAKPLIFIAPIYFYIKRFEQSGSFINAIGFKGKNLLREVVFAVTLICVLVVVGYISIFRSPLLLSTQVQWGTLLFVVALSVATSISEEVVGRG